MIVTLTIPSGVNYTFVDTNGGSVNGNSITWAFYDIGNNVSMTIPVKVKYTYINSNYVKITPSVSLKIGNYVMDTASCINDIYKDNYIATTTKHVPYMFGDEGSNNFRPNDGLTRAEMCVILARVYNLSSSSNINNFTDKNIIKDKYWWAEKSILACFDNGLVIGYDNGEFRPGANVTKAELLTILARKLSKDYQYGSYKLIDLDKQPVKIYSDVYQASINNATWYTIHLAELFRLNLVEIQNLNSYDTLNKAITRGETTNILNRVLSRMPVENSYNNILCKSFNDTTIYTTNYYEDIMEATADNHYYRVSNIGKEIISK